MTAGAVLAPPGPANAAFAAAIRFLVGIFGFFACWTIGANIVTLRGAPFVGLYFALVFALSGGVAASILAPSALIGQLGDETIRAQHVAFNATAPSQRGIAILAAISVLALICFAIVIKFTLYWPLWILVLGCAWLAAARPGTVIPSLATKSAPSAELQRDWLWFAALTITILAIYFLTNNPDGDDAFYLNLPIGMKEAAHGVMAFDTMLGDEFPLLMSTYRAESLPALSAMISAVTGLKVIYVAHALLPFVWCLVLAATMFVIGRSWHGDVWPAFAAVWLALLLALDGSLQGYSAHGIVRLYHGKAAIICFMAPLIVYVSWASLKLCSWQLGAAAAALQVCAIGFTANAIYLAPLTMGLVCAAWIARGSRRVRMRAFLLLLAAAYPVTVGLYLIVFDPPTSYDVVKTQTVAEDLKSIFPTKITMALAVLSMVFGAGAGLAVKSWRFASLYIAAVAVCVLNPVVWPYYADLVTGNLNYRLFWAMPVPMLLAAGYVAVRQLLGRFGKIGVALALAGLLIAPSSRLRAENGTTIGPSLRKVNFEMLQIAASANELTTEGARILAPTKIAQLVPAFEGHRKLVAVRTDYLVIRKSSSDLEAVEARSRLFDWVNGGGALTGDVRRLLGSLCVETVIIDRRSAAPARMTEELGRLGAEHVRASERFDIFRLELSSPQCKAPDLR